MGESDRRGPKDLFNFEQSFSEMYTAPSLKDVPWHAVLGNHDYGDGNHSDEPDGIACTRVSR